MDIIIPSFILLSPFNTYSFQNTGVNNSIVALSSFLKSTYYNTLYSELNDLNFSE